MATFWQLLRESIIIQGAITVMVVGAFLVMCVTGDEVPTELRDLLWVVVGFYFGSKVTTSVLRSGGGGGG